jgi:TonB family protein
MATYVQRLLVGMLLVGSVLPITATSYAEEDQTPFACLEQFTVPRYPSLARQARIQGAVTLQVKVGEAGRTEKLILSEAHNLLKQTVEDAAATAKFSSKCAGREIRVVFSFELDLEARPRNFDDGSVILQCPNRITIRAAPFPLSGSSSGKKEPTYPSLRPRMAEAAFLVVEYNPWTWGPFGSALKSSISPTGRIQFSATCDVKAEEPSSSLFRAAQSLGRPASAKKVAQTRGWRRPAQ